MQLLKLFLYYPLNPPLCKISTLIFMEQILFTIFVLYCRTIP